MFAEVNVNLLQCTFGAACTCTQTIHENFGDSRDKSYYQSNGVCEISIASDHHVQAFWLDFNLILPVYT